MPEWAVPGRTTNLPDMLAANIWHWWIGVVLTVVSLGAAVALAAGYLKSVSSQKYPGGKRRPEADV